MEAVLVVALAAATLRVATPLILGSLGEILIEKTGVLNLAIEGTLFLGAFFGFFVAYFTENAWLGVLAAASLGAALGLVMALLTVTLGVDQHVAGIGLTFLAIEMGMFIYRALFVSPGSPPHIETLEVVKIAPLSQAPVVGPLLEQHSLTYFALLLVPALHALLFNTPFGLRLRQVGESAQAADVAGVSVNRMRYQALIIGSTLIGLGGGFLSVAQVGSLTPGIIGGRGWICIALVVFGNWRPMRVVLGALLFGGVQAFQFRLQTMGTDIPYEFFLMSPYVLTLIVLALARGRAIYPAEFLKPYRREE